MGHPPSDNIVESNLGGSVTFEYVFFNGKRIARRDTSTNPPFYYFTDHLVSTSVVTDIAGVIKDDSDYYAYGGEVVYTNLLLQNYKFNGKERDIETNLDYFGARYYGSGIARFATPDWSDKPANVPYASFGNPQSLNLYSYVNNSPTTTRDPDGHFGAQPQNTSDKASPGAEVDAGPNIADTDKAQQKAQNKSVDYAIGVLKEAGNTLLEAGQSGASNFLHFSASNDAQEKGMTAAAIGMMLIPGGGEEKAGAKVEAKIISSIGKDAKLTKLAEEAGQSVQKGLDHLVQQLASGNTNPGLGTKSLGAGISYARARDGARVFFRQAGQKIEIVAKASKANEAKVINQLKSLY